MDKITKAVPLEDYRIEILTSSGVSGIFDVKPYLKGSAFKELVNESYFRTVHPAHHGIAWPDRKSTRLNSSHSDRSRMPSSA